MSIAELVFAFLLALLLATLLGPVGGYRTRRREASALATFLFFFLILFPLIWAGGLWLTPYGPATFGVTWAPFLTIGLVLILLFVAVSPRDNRRLRDEDEPRAGEQQIDDDEEAVALFGVSFFVLLITLALAILASYVWY